MDPKPWGPDWTPITPQLGSLFHADSHRLEQARRATLAHHVHRTARLGPWVLISAGWYKFAKLTFEPCALAFRFSCQPFALGVVSSNVFGDDFGVAEFSSQSVEHGRLNSLEIEGLRIWAYAALRRRRASDANPCRWILSITCHPGSARPAFQQP